MIYYIYVFRIKSNSKVIYVGSTRTIGGRLNEHRRAFRELKRRQPIHRYMIENKLNLLTDVEVAIVDFAESKKEALEKESFYFHEYKITNVNIWDAEKRSGMNSPVRKPLKTPDETLFFESQRKAAEHFGVTRYTINQMVKRGELVEIDVDNKYINENTGEKFISGYQLQKKYNIDSKTVNRLSKEGKIIINGMTIRKV